MLNGLTMSHQQILYNNFGTCSPGFRSYLNIEQELGQIASFNKIGEHINFTLGYKIIQTVFYSQLSTPLLFL